MLRNSMSIIRYHLKKIAFEFWRRQWHPTPVFLPGESQGQRSLAGYSLWGHTESDRTEQLSMYTSPLKILDSLLHAFLLDTTGCRQPLVFLHL